MFDHLHIQTRIAQVPEFSDIGTHNHVPVDKDSMAGILHQVRHKKATVDKLIAAISMRFCVVTKQVKR